MTVQVLSMPDIALSDIVEIIRGLGRERGDPVWAGFEVHPLARLEMRPRPCIGSHPGTPTLPPLLPGQVRLWPAWKCVA